MTYNILKISTNNVTIEIYLTFVGQRWDHHHGQVTVLVVHHWISLLLIEP